MSYVFVVVAASRAKVRRIRVSGARGSGARAPGASIERSSTIDLVSKYMIVVFPISLADGKYEAHFNGFSLNICVNEGY